MILLVKNPPCNLEGYIHQYASLKLNKEQILKSFPQGSFRLPNSLIRLAFHFSENIPWIEANGKFNKQPNNHVRGYQTSPIIFNAKNEIDVFSIELTPYGFYQIFGIPCSELKLLPIPLERIMGNGYCKIIENLAKLNLFNDRVSYMNTYFSSIISESHQFKRANFIQSYLDQFAVLPNVELLASNTFLTQRTLRRFFKKHFGMSPKEYLKLLRFEKSSQALSSKVDTSLNEIALQFGYYDQAHFTNEFNHFMQMTPTEYQKMLSI